MVNSSGFPWLADARSRLMAASDRLPHGLLISGPDRIGKSHLGLDLAHLLLCHSPKNKTACGVCPSCQLVENQVHPDFHVIAPEAGIERIAPGLSSHAERYWLEKKTSAARKPSEQIGVDAIRSLGEELAGTAALGRRKVALFPIAEAMNRNAANALLKLLEEPASETYLVLIASALHALPATIRSRCSQISCGTPDRAIVAEWLTAETGLELGEARALAASGVGPIELARLVASGKNELLLEWIAWARSFAEGKSQGPALLSQSTEAFGARMALCVLQRETLAELRLHLLTPQPKKGDDGVGSAVSNAFTRRFYSVGRAREGLSRSLDPQLCLEDILVNTSEGAEIGGRSI